MRCAFYCTSSSYNTEKLVKFFYLQGYEPKIYDQVIHLQNVGDNNNEKNIFYFSYGCVVFWDFNEAEEISFLENTKNLEINSIDIRILDTSKYRYSQEEEKTYIDEENDEIILSSSDPLIKLSLSFGLSQSVKLIAFENSVDSTIQKTKFLPVELKTKGKITLSKKKLSQLIGALFAERNLINLHSDILDIPEFFWRRPRYESYYIMASEYLDIKTRLEILNRRLGVIHELYGILSTELNHIHSARVETTIMILIIVEVIIALLKDILHWI